jgi:hypothetical protein
VYYKDILVSEYVDNSYLAERLYILQKHSGPWGWFLYSLYKLQCLVITFNLSIFFLCVYFTTISVASYVNIAHL